MTSASPPRFAHDSEAELARILDYYGVRWEYEPDVFPISWNADGAVIESFAPDFYLPDIDLYLELTTLKQPRGARRIASCAICVSSTRWSASSCSTRATSAR